MDAPAKEEKVRQYRPSEIVLDRSVVSSGQARVPPDVLSAVRQRPGGAKKTVLSHPHVRIRLRVHINRWEGLQPAAKDHEPKNPEVRHLRQKHSAVASRVRGVLPRVHARTEVGPNVFGGPWQPAPP